MLRPRINEADLTKQTFTAINGQLILATPANVNSLQVGNIAYISCDPSNPVYTGNVDASLLVGQAASKIQGDVNNPQGSVVLYSTSSAFCSLDATNFEYPLVFTTTNASAASSLESGLNTPAPANAVTTIQVDKSSVGNNGDGLGPSPTTAVAMIILYSITGIITALFLIIIITGAIRAHRHPERYGPRNVIGRPRQSRAKGIARAMLETLPIVKFGENEDANKPPMPMPMPNEGDIEMGTTAAEHEHHELENTDTRHELDNNNEENATKPKASSDSSNDGEEVMATTAAESSESSAGEEGSKTQESKEKQPAEDSHEGHDHAAHDHSAHPETSGSDNGLACSVCTDDFVKGQDIRVLPCGHKFHPECIDPWLLNVSGTCPLW